MRTLKTVLISAVITLFLTTCSTQKEEILISDFDQFTRFLHLPVADVCDSLCALGYQVDHDSLKVGERDFGNYTLLVTLVSDNKQVIDCIYLSYFPKNDESIVNNDAIQSLVGHIGGTRTLNNNSVCRFAMMTNAPDHGEEVLATNIDEALLRRDALDAAPSYDYYITYYWLGTDDTIETIEQLYDYIFRYSDTEMPNEAGITVISSLRNTEFPRQQLTVCFSCLY